MPKTLSK